MGNPEQTLVILSPAFPRNETETSWLPAQQLLVRELKNQHPQLNIIVISFLYPYEKVEYTWYTLKVIAFGGMYKRKLKRLWLWVTIWRKLKKIRKQHNVIGILSFWCGECALVGRWFARKNRLKHYCWVCGQDARKANKLVKYIRPRPDELVTISDFLTDEFHKNHQIRPAHLIPIGIDRNMFPELSENRDIDIIGAGSFSFQKNFDRFVFMIAKLREKFPSIKGIHCGSGEDEENIKGLVKKLALDQNIELMGMIPHPDVLRLMQRSKMLLHPSAYEGFGMVYLEALYAGAHVISFTKAMNREIENWHVVKTEQEMIAKAAELLQAVDLPHERVLVCSIDETSREFMKLFCQ